MAVELEKIQFKDFQEPAIDAENLNKLQDNIEEAINEGAGSGDGILTGSVIGYNGDTIPEGYEEVEVKTDTGWVDLSLTEYFSSMDNQNKPQYRKIDNKVYFRGLVQLKTNLPDNRLMATLPDELIPNDLINNLYFSIVYYNTTYDCSFLQITKNTKAMLVPASFKLDTWCSLDGISYLLD